MGNSNTTIAPGRLGKNGKSASNTKILCPFHDDHSPSLHVYADGFHCFACSAHGDWTDWLMMVEGKNRAEAKQILKTWKGPSVPPRRQNGHDLLAFATRLWSQAKPIADTPAIRYLADVRGIDTDALPDNINQTLRFHPRCPFGPGVRLPCLVARYSDVLTDEFAGVHRIALTEDVLFAGGKVQRMTLGPWPAPRAIKLWPAGSHLFLGEGIETVMAAATRLRHRDALMRPAWAAGSAGNIDKFPIVPGVEALTLLVDHDPNGEKCAAACRLTWRAAGRRVIRLRTDRFGSDFNDLVLEKHAS